MRVRGVAIPCVAIAMLGIALAAASPLAAQQTAAPVEPASPARKTVGTNASATADPHVFVLTQPMRSENLFVKIASSGHAGEGRALERGRDYLYDPAAGKIALLGDLEVRKNSEFLFVSGVVRDPSAFCFHHRIEAESVKVILGERRLVEGEGYEVDEREGVIHILDPEILEERAQYYIAAGPTGLCNRSDLGKIQHLLDEPAPPRKERPDEPAKTPRDDPGAHALYNGMIEAMRGAQSLSYTSRYRWQARGSEIRRCTYRIWLRKPNFFRVETTMSTGEKGGVLIGDGEQLWIHWPKGRPVFSTETTTPSEEERTKCYLRKATPMGVHSIGHEVGLLGAGMSMTIVDPSTFHGYTDSLQPHLDGVTARASDQVGDEPCDVIDVSYMDGQRVWTLWIAKRDHLPRRLHEVVHVSYDIETDEDWSDLQVNGPAAAELFAWQPPPDWKEWQVPDLENTLLKPGTQAPDFQLELADGATVKLADYRGKVVWLVFWRVG